MHDLKFIREHPEAFDAALTKRGSEPSAQSILAIDEERRKLTHQLNELQSQRNAASKSIGAAKAAGDEDAFNQLRADVERIKQEMPALEERVGALDVDLRAALSGLPNLAADGVPVGDGEEQNEEIRRWGEPVGLSDPKAHYDLGEALGQMDFETAAKMSGSRFALLKGGLARLERALASFMLDLQTEEFGYTEVQPPFLVKDDALYGTGQLPKFSEDLFRTTGDHWLIPTAEVSLTNIVRDQILDASDLPLRFTAWTPCFRSEAGAAGRDTRGMIRLHQFSKVELVSITEPDASDEEHERMTSCAEAVLQRLALPYRTMILSTGDMGFSARRTYDLEVWLPSQGTYREISSCSNCGDFQSRRMNTKARRAGEKDVWPPHTLNGSGLAVGRTLVAVMENYQQADGSIAVPDVLQPYMRGQTRISA